jgi:uncharacterized protein YjlB
MVEPQTILLEDDGSIPNNERLPLLFYPEVLTGEERTPAGCRKLFQSNGWTGTWVNGIYDYHHYHSTAHEVLGVTGGEARVQFGGPEGEIVEVQAGDLVVIPAGVGHCNLGGSGDFRVVGGYAGGRRWDMNTGKPGERPGVLENIREVPDPETDPVYGPDGSLLEAWS